MPRIDAARIQFSPEDRAEILKAIDESLISGQLTLGKHVREFEEQFAKLVGVAHACAVNSGTSALEIALRAFDVQGKEVLVPTNTFFATAAAVVHAGGKPRFVDVDPTTLSVDLDSLQSRWRPECCAAIVVHIGGAIAPEIEQIRDFCVARGMRLLEDAAHAHGSTLDGAQAGSFGDAAGFSFYPTKVMTSGEGGMLVTNSEAIHAEAQMYRDQGKASFNSNIHVRMGYNWRMSEIHAAIGKVHLARLPQFIEGRRRAARFYDAGISDVPDLRPAIIPPGSESNYYKYPVFLPPGVDRKAFKQLLKERWMVNLSGEVYELPLHLQPVFAQYKDADLPAAEDACRLQICLPIYPDLSEADVKYVINSLREALRTIPRRYSD